MYLSVESQELLIVNNVSARTYIETLIIKLEIQFIN